MAAETVKVMVRARPMNSKEKAIDCKSIVQLDEKLNQIDLQKPNDPDSNKAFSFDFTFGPSTPQQRIYEETAFSLVESVVEGYNGTIFAYGQTGCGKTHTMLGDPSQEKERGIIPRSFSHVMNIIESSLQKQFLVRCSYLEIYNEEIHDLLGKDIKQRMEMKEHTDKGVFIKDLTQNIVKTVKEMEWWMNIGTKSRSVGATEMNKDSSRSHSIFTLYVECSQMDAMGAEHFTAGKLNLVDLAGSERQGKTQATGDRLKEATKINLSLSALGNVISALVDAKSQHIPYRDSKLTRLLQDSLGGNTKTIMIAAVSPADWNYEETLSTLRYAARAKNIKNQPKVNEDPKDAMLKQYADEIKKLKELLQKQLSGQPIGNQEIDNEIQASQKIIRGDNNYHEMQKQVIDKEQLYEQEKQEKQKLEMVLREMEQKLMKGGGGEEQSNKKYSQLKSKLKKQDAEQNKLLKEKQKADDEVLFLGKQYNNLQEEITEMRSMINKLRKKYKQALNEIKDLEKEHGNQREEYLDMIRQQEKDSAFFKSLAIMMLKQDEIDILRADSKWNEGFYIKQIIIEDKTYIVPHFYFKEKKLKFPKITGSKGNNSKLKFLQAQDLIDQVKDNRDLSYDQNDAQEIKKYLNEEFEGMGASTQKFVIRNTNKNLYAGQEYEEAKPKKKKEEKSHKNIQLEPLKTPNVYLEPLQKHNFESIKLETQSSYPDYNNTDKMKKKQLQPLQSINFESENIIQNNNGYNQMDPSKESKKFNMNTRLELIQQQNFEKHQSQKNLLNDQENYNSNPNKLNPIKSQSKSKYVQN